MFETVESFQKKIYVLQQKTNQGLIDTIIQFCDEREIEYESVAPFVTGKLKSDIENEGHRRHLFDKRKKRKERSFPDIFSHAGGSERTLSSNQITF